MTQSTFSAQKPKRMHIPLWLRVVYHLLNLAFTRYRVEVDVEEINTSPDDRLPDGQIPIRANLTGTIRIVPDKRAVHEIVRDWLHKMLNRSDKVVAIHDEM